MQFHESRLDNGLQVIAEINPHVHSVALGFFVKTGARDETSEVSGVSHFLEHMAFKGSGERTADDVNRIFDDVGANYNASTGEEVTQYYAAILPEYLPQTFDLMGGLIFPSLREEDFDIEKNVILEEIGMYADLPGFTVYERAMQTHFAGHPLGQSILGTQESVGGLTVDQMRAYHAANYRAGNIILAVAGNTDWDEIVRLAEEHCAAWPSGDNGREITGARHETTSHFQQQAIQQQHLMCMTPAPAADNPLRYAADILSVVVGDDSGSRLYWEIVDPGYADSADLGYAEYAGSGAYLSYLCCSPDDVAANMQRLKDVLADVQAGGVTEQELEQARNKVASRVVLAGERPMGRLSSLGGNWVYRNSYRSVRDDLETIQSITLNDVRQLLDEYPLTLTTTCGIGPLAAAP